MSEVFVPDTFKRLFARFIDQLLMLIFYIPVMKPFYRLVFTDEDVHLPILVLIVLGLVPAIYEAVWLWVLQQTPGKWFMGLKVVDAFRADKELTWQQCLMRSLVGRLELFFSLAIYAVAFFRYDRTHLADWLAETRVVQFLPRAHRAKNRWFLGSIFVVMYAMQGVGQAAQVIKNVKIEQGQVSLRSVYNAYLGSMGSEWEEFGED